MWIDDIGLWFDRLTSRGNHLIQLVLARRCSSESGVDIPHDFMHAGATMVRICIVALSFLYVSWVTNSPSCIMHSTAAFPHLFLFSHHFQQSLLRALFPKSSLHTIGSSRFWLMAQDHEDVWHIKKSPKSRMTPTSSCEQLGFFITKFSKRPPIILQYDNLSATRRLGRGILGIPTP